MIPRPAVMLCGLAAAILLAVAPAAQGSRRTPKTSAAALAAFAKVRDAEEAQRSRVVSRMRSFDDDAVTELLLSELARAVTSDYRRSLVDAIGGVERNGVVPSLVQLLTPEQSQGGVVYSVARALARQGEPGMSELFAALGTSAPSKAVVRTACLSALSQAKTRAAWDAIAAFATDGPKNQRLQALTYLANAELTPKVEEVLVAGVEGSDLYAAVRCLAPLARAGWEDAKTQVLRLHKRLRVNGRASVRAELAELMVLVLDEDVFVPFLETISISDAAIDRVFGKLADAAAESQAFVDWLKRRGMSRKVILERCACLRILRRAGDAAVTDLLLAAARSRKPEIVYTALRCIGERGDRAAVGELRRLLRAPGDARRIEALFALHALLGSEPGWGEERLPLLSSSDRDLRTAALDVLADLGSEAGLDDVYGDLGDKRWPVRAAAYDYCRKVRSVRSIPKLIPRVDAEAGRLREDVLDTLQSLTGFRFPSTAKWREWWKPVAAGFQLIPADAFDKKPTRRSGVTVTYYDIPLISDRVCFVVDRSGSMSANIGTSADRIRLDEAKRQLERVVSGMPERHRFDVIYFDTRIESVFDGLLPGTAKNKKRALAFVDAAKTGGGTNVHDAMEKAFEDESVDTIYLLSDGYPSAGKIRDPSALADEIARWNRTRQIRIHCIAIGSKSPMLERIAKESGGEFAHVR